MAEAATAGRSPSVVNPAPSLVREMYAPRSVPTTSCEPCSRIVSTGVSGSVPGYLPVPTLRAIRRFGGYPESLLSHRPA